MYRILSFDGGGIRGLVTLAILKRLEAQIPNLIQRANLLAGTSTGGIIALGLAAGKSVDELISLYRDNGERIFDDSWFDDLRDIGGLIGADYDQKNLEQILKGIFKGLRLKDLGKRVLIPSFNLDNGDRDERKRTWNPKFFHNFPGEDSDGDESVVEVALDTSAAPTYFPTHGTYIDGGVVDPVPVDLLREMGVARVIAVNTIPTPAYLRCRVELEREQASQRRQRTNKLRKLLNHYLNYFAPGNILDTILRSFNGAQMRVADLACLRADVVLRPLSFDGRWHDFRRPGKYIALGRREAEEHLEEIKALVARKAPVYEPEFTHDPLGTTA